MNKYFIALCILVGYAGIVTADSLEDRLEHGHALLRSGDPEGALQAYQELLTEEPESESLHFSMGCATYARAEKEAGLQASRDAAASFGEALNMFEKVETSPDPLIRRHAAYNRSNAMAQLAKQSVAAGKQEEAVEAYKKSIASYEDVLKIYPDYTAAKRNLDHMRYELKKMLQNPPPPQEQQQKQEQKDSDQNKQQDQQDQQKQQEQQQKQQEQQQNKQEQQNQDQQQQEQQASPEQQEPKDQQDEKQQTQGEEELKPEDRQNMEAILQSLEDVDDKEQRDTKNQRQDIQIRRDWW